LELQQVSIEKQVGPNKRIEMNPCCIDVRPGLLVWDGPFLARLNGLSSVSLYGPYVARLVANQQASPRLAATLPHMAVYGPPTLCGTGHFWPAWYFQMRRPVYVIIIWSARYFVMVILLIFAQLPSVNHQCPPCFTRHIIGLPFLMHPSCPQLASGFSLSAKGAVW